MAPIWDRLANAEWGRALSQSAMRGVSGTLEQAHRLLRLAKVDFVRFHHVFHPLARRMRLLSAHQIGLLFDVGANAGQYGSEMRSLGFQGKLVSFEPLSLAFQRLRERAATDPNWQVENIALGDKEESSTIHVAGNSTSSSLLDMLPSHEESAPTSQYVGSQTIQVRRLDDRFDHYAKASDRVFLKIDAQGYEQHVLDGARQSLAKIIGLQVELSLVPLYAGAPSYLALIQQLADAGFQLMSVEPGHSDPVTGQVLQMDGLFFRSDASVLA